MVFGRKDKQTQGQPRRGEAALFKCVQCGFEVSDGFRFQQTRLCLDCADRAGLTDFLERAAADRRALAEQAAQAATQQLMTELEKLQQRVTALEDRLAGVEKPRGEAAKPSATRKAPTTGSDLGGYIDNGDGTVTDPGTGLMWMRCALGQRWNGATVSGEAAQMQWHNTTAAVRALNRQGFAGYQDWRVPKVEELQTLVDPVHEPAIHPGVFPNPPEELWSASQDFYRGPLYIDFSCGEKSYSINGTSHYAVLLVRAGDGK